MKDLLLAIQSAESANSSLEEVLDFCIAVGEKLKVRSLRSWAEMEKQGYPRGYKLTPSYRLAHARLCLVRGPNHYVAFEGYDTRMVALQFPASALDLSSRQHQHLYQGLPGLPGVVAVYAVSEVLSLISRIKTEALSRLKAIAASRSSFAARPSVQNILAVIGLFTFIFQLYYSVVEPLGKEALHLLFG